MAKYNFPGIKKMGAKGIELALASTSWGAAVLAIPLLRLIIDDGLQLIVNWLSNKGLIVLNIGDILIEGKFDQQGFDEAFDKALAAVGINKDNLTEKQKKAIDDTVIAAFRKFAPLTKHN